MRLTPNRKLAILCTLIAIPTAIVAVVELRASDAPAAADDDGEPLRRYTAPRDDQRMRDEVARLEATERRDEVLPSLFGDRPGAPGALFAALDLRRGRWSIDPVLRAAIDAFDMVTGGHVEVKPDEILVSLPPPPDRSHFGDVGVAAATAWKRGDDDRWIDPDELLRVTIVEDDTRGATVHWERSVPAVALFPPDASTPGALVPAIGAPADAPLPLDAAADRTATGFSYRLPSLGWSPDPIRVEVETAHGVVTAVHVETGALREAEYEQVRAALRARYGAHAQLDGPGSWRAGPLAIRSTLLVDSRITNQGPLMGYRLDITRAR
jgi:hypothetical protein